MGYKINLEIKKNEKSNGEIKKINVWDRKLMLRKREKNVVKKKTKMWDRKWTMKKTQRKTVL